MIYMEGTGSQEYRFLHDALEEDPSIKCTSLERANQTLRGRGYHGSTIRAGFPTTREELLRL